MSAAGRERGWGFSMWELIVAIAILGIVAALIVPQATKGTATPPNATLAANLTDLRNAVGLFAAEHETRRPVLAMIAAQLTQYTCESSTVAATDRKEGASWRGPYLKEVPPLPVGDNQGKAGFTATLPLGSDTNAGWYYNQDDGQIRANTRDDEMDPNGKPFNQY
jgi:prepilin-type N-terminal cleavage/methylation domain-containing protein